MSPIRCLPLFVLLLAGCAGDLPPSAPPGAALAEKVRTLSDNDLCSDAFAGTLAGYRIAPGSLVGFELPTVTHDHPGAPFERQAWFKLAGGGSLVLDYDATQCWVFGATPRGGAVLPAAA